MQYTIADTKRLVFGVVIENNRFYIMPTRIALKDGRTLEIRNGKTFLMEWRKEWDTEPELAVPLFLEQSDKWVTKNYKAG